MKPVRRKQFVSFGSGSSWPHVTPPLTSAPPSVALSRPQLGAEYLAWAHWLDALHKRASQGNEADAWALAEGKLAFVLRRSLLLREKVMLGGSLSRAVTEETAALVQELEQVIGELTGREMLAVDDWPLPYRLYRRQGEAGKPATGATPQTPPPAGHDRRQGSRQRKNLLSAQAQQDCQQAVGCLRLALEILHRQPALAKSDAWQAANLGLARVIVLGHLSSQPGHKLAGQHASPQ
ncbi:hypothetical protein [Vogesella alkaliphila]|uniref:Uncharacterized protein n=1 Tax=Vogesella alkaliphila TaxID=1193621 RepID=A0ABQ2YMG2_9NEIS|nr:hypothetical protein [Vogesella alkaliphila]GGX89286.1 hypothetical protein GCM10011290_16390 [Vogesella alkaliphila]